MRPYLRVANVYEDRLDLTDVKEMNFSPKEYEVFRLEHGDVLLNEGQSPHLVGRPAIWRGEIAGACFQNTLIRFRAHAGVVPGFALAVFRAQMHLLRYLRIAQITTNIAHLSSGRFAEVEFPLPPTPEQHRITLEVDKQLTRLDAAVATLNAVQAKLKRARASVLKAAVEGRLVPTEAELARADGRSYDFASALLERILAERRSRWPKGKKYQPPAEPKTDDLPDLPEGWIWAQVKDVGEVKLGRQRSPEHHAGPHLRPYLRVANVYEDRLDLTDVKEMNFSPKEYDVFRLERGDVLLNEGQSPYLVGRPAIWRGEIAGACFQNTLIRFRAHAGLLPGFALTVFRAQMHVLRYIRIAQITTNIAHLSVGRFVEVEFPLPPTAEQHRIVAEVERRLSVIDNLEHTVEQNLARCGRLRQSILKRAFEGKLVAQDPFDEPASRLLERIRVMRTKRDRGARQGR